MIPELSSVYGLSPEEVWSMTQSQYLEYVRHHRKLVERMSDNGSQ